MLRFCKFQTFTSRREVSAAAAFYKPALPGSHLCQAPSSTALLQVKSPRVLSPVPALPRCVRRKPLTDPDLLFQNCIGHSQALVLIVLGITEFQQASASFKPCPALSFVQRSLV